MERADAAATFGFFCFNDRRKWSESIAGQQKR
jgi:hypothetical protein